MELHFLTGLPRTGSTTLASILYQNPSIHTEGVSVLCDLMWEVQNIYFDNPNSKASGKKEVLERIIRDMPQQYYKDVERSVVIDKAFTWTLNGNIDMILKYVSEKPKFIVMHRPISEIVTSFVGLMERTGSNGVFETAFQNATGTERERREKAVLGAGGSLQIDIQAYETARSYPDQSLFHYIEYKDLVEKPHEVLFNLYEFLEIPQYKHDFENIVNHHPENDAVWGLNDMHTVRSSVSFRK